MLKKHVMFSCVILNLIKKNCLANTSKSIKCDRSLWGSTNNLIE